MSRRTWYVPSGAAVLLASIVYVQVGYHLFFVEHRGNVVFVAAGILSFVTGALSFVGAYLLLTGGRSQT
jgi:hypothetical protein